MKIYEVTIKGYNNEKILNVFAENIDQCVDHTKRYCRTNYMSSYEIIAIRQTTKVDVHYKTASKKKK